VGVKYLTEGLSGSQCNRLCYVWTFFIAVLYVQVVLSIHLISHTSKCKLHTLWFPTYSVAGLFGVRVVRVTQHFVVVGLAVSLMFMKLTVSVAVSE